MYKRQLQSLFRTGKTGLQKDDAGFGAAFLPDDYRSYHFASGPQPDDDRHLRKMCIRDSLIFPAVDVCPAFYKHLDGNRCV